MLLPRASLGKDNVTAAVLRGGAALEKQGPESCPEHVPASWEPAGAGEEAAAALGNQAWAGQSSGCAALGLPWAGSATWNQCHHKRAKTCTNPVLGKPL